MEHAGTDHGAEEKREVQPFPISCVDADYLLTAEEVEAAGGPSKRTLERLRAYGGGPPYVRLGPKIIRYRAGTYFDWVRERTFVHAAEEHAARLTAERQVKRLVVQQGASASNATNPNK
jgi:hypothetical protein